MKLISCLFHNFFFSFCGE